MVKINENEVTKALSLLNDAMKQDRDETKRLLEDRYSTLRDIIVETFRTKAAVPSNKRVALNTRPRAQRRIWLEMVDNVANYVSADKGNLTRRIKELDQEWDIERIIETNASSLVLAGIILSRFNSRFIILPFAVGGFLLQHVIQGWCPPVPILRGFGVRTQREIDDERNALKRLRGDFGEFKPQGDARKIAVDLLSTQAKS